MWSWLAAAAMAGDDDADGLLLEDQEETQRGYFRIGAGVSAGRVDETFVPVLRFNAGIGREMGAKRSHILLMDLDFDIASSESALYHQRAALGWDVRTSRSPVQLSVGPRLWMAQLSDRDGRIAASPGLSLSAALGAGLGRDWSLQISAEGGRGTGPAWSTLDPLPLTHIRAGIGVISPIGLGLGLGVHQVGSLQAGLLSFGLGF